MSAAYKWLPVIAQDYCTGCASCVDACDHGCLELVWDFATLQRPEDCDSEGACAEACPEDVIEMKWVETVGDQSVGYWRTTPPPVPPRSRRWLWGLLPQRG